MLHCEVYPLSSTNALAQKVTQDGSQDPCQQRQSALLPGHRLTILPALTSLAWQWQVLLRKGGIREPTFRPAGRRFLLLPTSFHSAAGSLKLGAADRYAQVRGAQR